MSRYVHVNTLLRLRAHYGLTRNMYRYTMKEHTIKWKSGMEKCTSTEMLNMPKPEKIELANIPPQKISLIDNKPVRIKNYQLGFHEQKELVKLMRNGRKF